jgi:alpha-1,3-mannosyltransferase
LYEAAPADSQKDTAESQPVAEQPPTPEPPKEPPPSPTFDTSKYIKAIKDPKDKSFERVQCPTPNLARYGYLRTLHFANASIENPPSYKPFLISLNLYECIKVLPRLLGSVAEVIRVLGPYNVALSIVEGRSSDGTFEVLSDLKQALPEGVEYFFTRSDINPWATGGGIGRMSGLAQLRNLALQPLMDHGSMFSPDNTTVIFLNDVALCPDDILELLHQKIHQKADMTCGMDWNAREWDRKNRLTFYDVWIARTMSGQSFFNIPFGGSWNESWYLFAGDNDSDRLSKKRFEQYLPFQVFACWNGGVVFDAKPIMSENVTFRANREDECYQGEVSLFCKDLWIKGHGRIAVVPSVNVAYDDETTKRIQKEKGLVSKWAKKNAKNKQELVPWHDDPPEHMLCIPNWVHKVSYWVPWNE